MVTLMEWNYIISSFKVGDYIVFTAQNGDEVFDIILDVAKETDESGGLWYEARGLCPCNGIMRKEDWETSYDGDYKLDYSQRSDNQKIYIRKATPEEIKKLPEILTIWRL